MTLEERNIDFLSEGLQVAMLTCTEGKCELASLKSGNPSSSRCHHWSYSNIGSNSFFSSDQVLLSKTRDSSERGTNESEDNSLRTRWKKTKRKVAKRTGIAKISWDRYLDLQQSKASHTQERANRDKRAITRNASIGFRKHSLVGLLSPTPRLTVKESALKRSEKEGRSVGYDQTTQPVDESQNLGCGFQESNHFKVKGVSSSDIAEKLFTFHLTVDQPNERIALPKRASLKSGNTSMIEKDASDSSPHDTKSLQLSEKIRAVQEGTLIHVFWSLDQRTYTAKVLRAAGNIFYIQYVDDGVCEWIDLATNWFETA